MGGEKCVNVESVHAERKKKEHTGIVQLLNTSVNFQLDVAYMCDNQTSTSCRFLKVESEPNWHVLVSYRIMLGHV